MATTTTKGVPYPEPADANNVPADVGAVAAWLDANPGIAALSTAQRDALATAQKWAGRVIWNTTTLTLQRCDGSTWVDVVVTNGGQTITASAAGVVPLTLKGTSGQTADLLDVQDSTGAHMMRVTKEHQIIAGDGTSYAFVDVNGAAGQNRLVRWQTNSSDRWVLVATSDAESGSNAGSNLAVNRYSDAGAFIDSALLINRATNLLTVPGVYSNTVGTAANVNVDSSGNLKRYSSSLRYKANVTDATDVGLALDLRPVTFTSTCDGDDPDLVHWGFIAEEVAEVDPRWVEFNDDGQPEGVQYTAIIPALVGLIRQQQTAIAALTERVAALEA